MATYICKCGRRVKKAANADNTSNRDTEGCAGCPYLLPWGPFVWDEVQKDFTQDIKGQECRMSREIRYDTTYQGGAKDKNTMSIASLDLDFLDVVQAWITDRYPHEILHAEFSRGSIRGTDYSQQGRYRMPIYCAANKKGVAAKAALIEHFFTPHGTRKGVTQAQELNLVLRAIERGKAREKENTMKKQELEAASVPDLSTAQADPITYQNEYGTLFAVQEHKGAPALMCKPLASDAWTLSGVLAAVQGEAYTTADLQEVLDEYARAHGWKPVKEVAGETAEDSSEVGCLCASCTCTGCHEECFGACNGCGHPVDHCNSYQTEGEKRLPASNEPPEVVAESGDPSEECPYLRLLENSRKYTCQCSICGDKFANREICNKSFLSCGWYLDQQEKDNQKDNDEEEPIATDPCLCRTCEQENCFAHGCTKECPANAEDSCLTSNCPEYIEKENAQCQLEPAAPTGDAAATTDGSAATPTAAETTTTLESEAGASTSSVPASRADAGAAAQSLSAVGPASLEAPPSDSLAFDFGADTDTNAGLLQDAQIFMAGSMARVMAAKRAHERTACHYRGSWGKWCDFVGISRDTGDNMVRVAEQFGNIQVDGQNLIDLQPLKLLYAASKPSTPPEIRQKVENLDITTHKQYQDLLARYNAEKSARQQAEQERDEAATHIQAARDMQIDTARERDTALRRAAEAEKQRDGARDALAAAKLRGDKLKAENDALKAHPIEAQVVDEEEIDRRAQARANELTAPLREELEALRNRHPADLEEAEQAIRDAYDSAVYTGRVIESAWRSLCPLLPRMDADRRELALNQIVKIISTIQGECIQCL